MNLTNGPAGYAFKGDYPESYGNRVSELRRIVARQVSELNSIGSPRGAELLGILRGRRSGRRDLPQIEVRQRERGRESLVARGELLMRSDTVEARDLLDVMKSRGFDDVAERRGGLCRLRNGTALLPTVERAIEECTRKGARGWTNYVATMAAVGKGIGGPEPIQYSEAYAAPGGAAGPKVAVIDTGIPMAQRGDGWLNGVPRTEGDIDQLDLLPAGPDGFLDFQAGHGTFVSGIVLRVAPGADVRVYKAADSDGFASDDMIADALLRAYEDGAQVINLSLGMRTADDEPPPALAAAAEYITQDSGGAVVMIAAAGNFGDDAPCWPAALPGVEAVAGLKSDLTPAQWSSHGDVQFSTVAEGIRSTFVTGLESPVFDREPEEFGNDAWALWSGTSFAAPQIAGAIVRICRENPGTTPRQAVALLAGAGQPVPGFGSAMQILEGVL